MEERKENLPLKTNMSLLVNQSYANPSTPLWLSSGGGTITGNLTIDGNLAVDGPAQFFGGHSVKIANPSTLYLANTGQSQAGALLYSDNAATPNGFIETNGTIYLGRIGASTTANTSFIPSAPTTNGDVLSVGGQILSAAGKGITPLSSSTASTNIPVGVSTSLAPTPAIPITNGQTYDVQVNGYFAVPIGTTPAPLDKIEVLVSVGSGTSPAFFQYSSILNEYPGWAEDPYVAGTFRPFQIRARLPSNSNLANITILATLSGVGVYPAGIDAVLSQVSVVRVA